MTMTDLTRAVAKVSDSISENVVKTESGSRALRRRNIDFPVVIAERGIIRLRNEMTDLSPRSDVADVTELKEIEDQRSRLNQKIQRVAEDVAEQRKLFEEGLHKCKGVEEMVSGFHTDNFTLSEKIAAKISSGQAITFEALAKEGTTSRRESEYCYLESARDAEQS